MYLPTIIIHSVYTIRQLFFDLLLTYGIRRINLFLFLTHRFLRT